MMIDTLVDLKRLFKLCRAEGVSELEWEGIKLKLGEKPVKLTAKEKQAFEEMEHEPTDEELQYFSVGGQ